MYLVAKESIGNCRSSSDFKENLMKIHKQSENPNFKILKRTKFGDCPRKHVYLVSKESIEKCRRSSNLKK